MRIHDSKFFGLACATVLVGCSGGGGGGSGFQGATNSTSTNLGVAAVGMLGKGRLWLIAASERGQGADLDGDGDALNPVLQAYDALNGTLQNLALPVPGLPAYDSSLTDDGRAVFPVSEIAQGRDDNGDGDVADLVLHLLDVRQGTIENLGLAIAPGLAFASRLEGELLLMGVDELSQGQDLDGDGQLLGEVIQVRDFSRGVTRNLSRRMQSRLLHAVDRRAAFLITETSATGDLNGDGDELDSSVLEIYDGSRGVLAPSELATDGGRVLLADAIAAVLVSEHDQGVDLNGDGDLDDLVFHDFDPLTGITRNLGLEGSPYPSREGSRAMALIVAESPTAGDLDADGDQTDVVPFLYEPTLGRSTSMGLAQAGGMAPFFLGRSLIVVASEAEQGNQDLDGDGDALDFVPHVYDLVNRTMTNLEIGGAAFGASGSRLLVARLEQDSLVDWNGDGDKSDAILFAWDEDRARLENSRLSAVGLLDARADRVLLLQSELREKRDLNGDGDQTDLVFVSYAFGAVLKSNTALAGRRGVLVGDDAALVLVDEWSQGVDLNGDGDRLDSVLHRVDFTR